jgi:hypothetical protein
MRGPIDSKLKNAVFSDARREALLWGLEGLVKNDYSWESSSYLGVSRKLLWLRHEDSSSNQRKRNVRSLSRYQRTGEDITRKISVCCIDC